MDVYSSESSFAPLSIAVIEAIAAQEGVDPTALCEPLHAVIDPEALNSLFRSGDSRVTFVYHGYEVTVSSDRRIELQCRDDP